MDNHERRSKYQELAAAGKFCGSVNTAIRNHNKREKAREIAAVPPIAERLDARKIIIPLGSYDISRARETAETRFPQRKNWNTPEPTKYRHTYVYVSTINEGRYSSRVTYTHYSYTPLVTSYALIQSPSVVRYAHYSLLKYYKSPNSIFSEYLAGDRDITAPRGYAWKKDANGLLLSRVSSGDDYHPTSDDLLKPIHGTVKKLRELAEKRAETKRQEKHEMAAIKKAESEGATVCLPDSLRAGNCEAGTRQWVTRHGLDAGRHYTPSELLKMANGDRPRVALVVTVALRRHRQEMERGYAVLSDHRVGV